MSDPVIEARALHKTYRRGVREVRALEGVDLVVDAGTFLAIEGPSGSGKSTLLHLLAGIDLPDQGEVRLLGEAINTLPERQRTDRRRRHIGLLLQRFDLIPTLSAAENIAVPGILAGHRAKPAHHRAHQLLDELNLLHRSDHRPAELSGGEQQRVGLARALYHQPPIIIADEPTGALDTVSGDEILALLRGQRATGRTVIIATHDVRASAHADRTQRLLDGLVHPSPTH